MFRLNSLVKAAHAFAANILLWCERLLKRLLAPIVGNTRRTKSRSPLWIFAATILLITSLSHHPQNLIDVAKAVTLKYTGVSLAGAEFGERYLPGTYNVNYTYPTRAEVDYFMSKGMNTFRLPFRWERLQRQQFGSFDTDEQKRLNDIVSYATSKGASVILDPHNYARYYNQIVGQQVPVEAFADFWNRLANLYKSNSRVIFGLMNEPHDMATEIWRDDANKAIQAIRRTGATNLILVPGNGWTGGHSWNQSWYGTPNATAMLGITDSGNNYAFEVHQYLDSDFSGNSATCVSRTIGSEKLVNFTQWLRQNGKRGFLGELGGGRNDTCYAAIDDILNHVDNNSDVWLGWAYWAAGPWWGDYILTLEPVNGVDRPQMVPLSKHIGSKVASPVSNPASSLQAEAYINTVTALISE